MAMCLLPRAIRLQTVRLQHRTTSTLCEVCTPYTGSDSSLALEPKTRRSRAVNKDSVCMSVIPYTFSEALIANILAEKDHVVEQDDFEEVRSISVINLLSVLRKSSPMNFSTLLEYTKLVQKSAALRRNVLQSEIFKGCLNGPDLDCIFGIDQETEKVNSGQNVPYHERLERIVSSYDSSVDFCFQENNSMQSGLDVSAKLNISADCLHHNYDTRTNSESPVAEMITKYSVQLSHKGNWTNILSCVGPSQSPEPKLDPDNKNRPNLDELRLIEDHMNDFLPRCFSRAHNYRIYSPQVIFENNFALKPLVTNGIKAYVLEMTKYRMFAHFRYANVRMNVLKSTVHEEDGSVRIRWRVSGIPQVRAFMFWKFLPWKYSKAKSSESEWMDGISTFYVQAKTGVVYKHKMDRVIVDEDVAPSAAKTVPLGVSGAV